MKQLIKLFVTLVLVCFIPSVFAEPVSDPTGQFVEQTMTRYLQENNIPGAAVQLYVNGKAYSYYFGYADKENATKVTDKTIFEIGSISKIMTSLLLTEEIDWSKMQLSDSVTKYLPDLSDAFEPVTLQQLATHTAGLPMNLPANIETQEALDNYLAGAAPNYQPGQKWVYSNVGMGVLGEAIEKTTNKDLNQLYQKQIFKPLGMQTIGLNVPKKLKQYYAQGYDSAGNPVEHFSPTLLPAAAGVKVAAGDMQRFLSAAIGLPGTPEKIFYPMRMTQAVYVKLRDRSQGLAWQIYPITGDSASYLIHENSGEFGPLSVNEVLVQPTFNGDALIDKTGMTRGFRAYIAVLPNKKSGIVILTNRGTSDNNIAVVGREILLKLTHLS